MSTARFRYIGDEAREVSMLPEGTTRRVEPDEMFEVPTAVAKSYECQPHLFDRNDKPSPKPKTTTSKEG